MGSNQTTSSIEVFNHSRNKHRTYSIRGSKYLTYKESCFCNLNSWYSAFCSLLWIAMFLVLLETDKDAIQIPIARREIVVEYGLLKDVENVATIRTVHSEKIAGIQDALTQDQLKRRAVRITIVHLGIVVVYGVSKNVMNGMHPARTHTVNLKPLTTCTAYLINANEEGKN